MHTFSFKNSGDVKKHDVRLSRREVRDTIWGVHSTGTGQPVETQDVFFWRLAGRSAPTGLAIVHWMD